MSRHKLGTLILLLCLSAAMLLALDLAFRASAASEPRPLGAASPPPPRGLRAPQTDFAEAPSDPTTSTHGDVAPQGVSDAGDVLGVFTNTWSHSGIGLVFDPVRNYVRYAHESQSSAHNPTIYDIDRVAHTPLLSVALSAKNPGWPWSLDNRTGVAYDFNTDTYFLPQFDGDLANADDNIVEITADGIILNAWEMDDQVGNNDSSDGSKIDNVMDIAVVPGAPTRYFVTAAYDGNVVYEIALTKTVTWWTPSSWSTLVTYTVPGLTDNLGIDYDAENQRLYHSGWHTDTVVVTDLSCTPVESFTCPSEAGYHSGVTYIEGSDPPEVWVTNFTDDRTTRCEAPGAGPTGVEWGKSMEGQPWTPDLVVTAETSDTITVVDVFTTTQAVSLIEEWAPDSLRLLDWVASPDVGTVITGINSLRVDMPPFPTVITVTKWFHVEPSTWVTTTLTEALLLEGEVHEERPVTVEKQPPVLTLDAHHPHGVLPGSVATYTLLYANHGGYENDVSVLSVLPVTAPIVHAYPLPDFVSADGTLAVWNVGDVANGDVGEIGVAVGITATATPSQSIGIESAIRNHLEEVVDDAVFDYHVEPPPEIEYTWEKLVDGQLQPPGTAATVETWQTIQVVDVISAPNVLLIEAWEPEHLDLIELALSAGTFVTTPNGVEWLVPPGQPMPVVLTKTFQVQPCTWTETQLWEELLVDPGTGPVPVQQWPVFFEKRPPQLWIENELTAEPEVLSGQEPSFILHYGNAGGLESGAWISATFPAGVSFVGADPPPTGHHPQGRWAWWDLGKLAGDEGGLLSVSVELSPDLPPYETLHAYTYIYDHMDIERGWSPITMTVKPVEPVWEKEVWVDGRGPLAPEDGPRDVVPGEEVTVIDRVHVAAAAPVSLTLTEGWTEALAVSGWEASGGSVEKSHGGLIWHGEALAPNTWHALTKTFRAVSGDWNGGTLTETLVVAGADPTTHVRRVEFERNTRLFLPLILRR